MYYLCYLAHIVNILSLTKCDLQVASVQLTHRVIKLKIHLHGLKVKDSLVSFVSVRKYIMPSSKLNS